MMTMQPGRVIEERETSLDLATFEGCLESLRARNLIFDHEKPDTLLDVSGFDGVLARFVNLAFDREQCGTCARWRVMAHSFLDNDFDFPIGYIDALPVHNRLWVTFYADKPNEALNEFHRRMIEKVMRRVAEQETRPTVESAGPREQFKGTPAEFGVMVRNFNRQKPQPDKTFFVVTDPPDEKIPPDANPVRVKFGCFPNMDYYDCGWIVAQSLPGGKSELTAGAWAENGWPNLEPLWNVLCGEMRRQGWLDAQPTQVGSAPEAPQLAQHQTSNVTIVAQVVNIGGDVAGRDITKEPPSRQPATSVALGNGQDKPSTEEPITNETCEILFYGTMADLMGQIDNWHSECVGGNPNCRVSVFREPAFKSLYVRFIVTGFMAHDDDANVCGEIVARTAKHGLTLRVWFQRGKTNLVLPLWQRLHDQMKRDGWLDAQPKQVGSAPARPEALARLRQQLEDRFSEEELKTVTFDLGIDYESLPAQGKAGKARELVAYCDRTGRISELVARCRKLRPNVSWEEVP